MKAVRRLESYGRISFPHCACDSRKNGHVIAIIAFDAFRLQACKVDGTPEVCFSVHPECVFIMLKCLEINSSYLSFVH